MVHKHVRKHVENVRNKVNHHIVEIKKTRVDPHTIALAFSIGTFISVLPTPFINLWIGALVVLTFKNLNKYALFLALLIWNPITLIPLYSLSFTIGNILFADTPLVEYDFVLLNQAYNFTRRFLIGNLIIAIPMAILMYVLVRLFVYSYIRIKKSKSAQEN